jgi:hypothetical protein
VAKVRGGFIDYDDRILYFGFPYFIIIFRSLVVLSDIYLSDEGFSRRNALNRTPIRNGFLLVSCFTTWLPKPIAML